MRHNYGGSDRYSDSIIASYQTFSELKQSPSQLTSYQSYQIPWYFINYEMTDISKLKISSKKYTFTLVAIL